LPNGDEIDSTWENDRIHGKGILTKGGEKTEMIWYYDLMINQTDQDACCDGFILNLFCLILVIVPVVLTIVMESPVFLGILGGLWLCNIMEACCSKTKKFLGNMKDLSKT